MVGFPLTINLSFQAAIAYFVLLYLLWRLLRPFITKHPLDNISGPPSLSFLRGNFGQVYHPQAWEFHKMLVEKYSGVVKLQGIWGSKQLYIADPTALHHIFVKDQYSYELASWLVEDNKIVFGEGIFSTTGEHHRKQKKMFNPAFSSAHLRDMVPTFYEVAYKLRDAIASKVEDSSQEVDIFHWTSRTALEIIGRAGLGYSFDKFDDGPPDEYSVAIKNLVSVVFKLSLIRRFLPFITTFGSPGFRRFLLERLPSKNIQKAREIVDLMHRTSVNIFHVKKAALQQGDEAVLKQVGQGKDIMSILLKANIEAGDENRLSESELISQITCMIFGAMDTTSRAMARIIHVLAQNPDAQKRVRNEIMEAQQANGDIDFDTLMDLPYLDAIMRETLRLHPTNPFIPRVALDDMILPVSKPIIGEDGMQMCEIFVPKGTNISVSILGVNRYSELWGEDAYEWKPERWLSSLPDSVTQARIPGIYSHMSNDIYGGDKGLHWFPICSDGNKDRPFVTPEIIQLLRDRTGDILELGWSCISDCEGWTCWKIASATDGDANKGNTMKAFGWRTS